MGKVCTNCKAWKPDDDYYPYFRARDGLQSWCKDCMLFEGRTRKFDPNPLLTEKRCVECEVTLPVAEFHKNARLKDGYRSICKSCSALRRRYHLYGISAEQYEEMLADQREACAICGSTDRPLFVDHDHACCPGSKSCGLCVRALICQPCNTGLGNFEDNSSRIRDAADYVDYHKPWEGGTST